MKHRIIWKFLNAYIVLIIVAIFVLNFFVSLKLRDYYELQISERLKDNVVLLSDIVNKDLAERNQEAIQRKTKVLADELQLRITVIDNKGGVLGDSEKDPLLMESHSNRLEVIRALESGVGESNRFSDTSGYNMKYVAAPVVKNSQIIGVVRVALPLIQVEAQIRFIYRIVLMGGLVAVVIALIIGYITSKRITNPIRKMQGIAQSISQGNFNERIDIKTKDELEELAKSLNKMADRLQTQIDNLKKMDRVRTDFVANVSHELKTPLTSIKGFIETLEDGAIDDKQNAKRFISIIKKHADGLSNIINDLLSLSELELDKDTLRKENFDLKDLIEEVSLGFGHAISSKHHKFEKDFTGNSFNVRADKTKIEQVLVNLIDNAIKYTKEEGIVKISLVNNSDRFSIIVEDNGIGIPQDHIKRIFERFYRVDKARSRSLGGTGLGLAIVKHIVALHSGDIAIESQIDKGTKVTISLPKA
ncbi:HAMP domain-containing protein [bacterium]|nr:HAMP domain-containing protein [bacterium]